MRGADLRHCVVQPWRFAFVRAASRLDLCARTLLGLLDLRSLGADAAALSVVSWLVRGGAVIALLALAFWFWWARAWAAFVGEVWRE